MPVKAMKRANPKSRKREPLIITTQPVRLGLPNPIVEPDKRSSLERHFLFAWKAFGAVKGYPEPVEQHKFHATRKWRFDFAWPEDKVAVELEGGTWSGRKMAHNTGTGIQRDIEKHNAAALMGWTVLRYTAKDMHCRPGEVVCEVTSTLGTTWQENTISSRTVVHFDTSKDSYPNSAAERIASSNKSLSQPFAPWLGNR
jgi:very-short-patch-repair endonuclease